MSPRRQTGKTPGEAWVKSTRLSDHLEGGQMIG